MSLWDRVLGEEPSEKRSLSPEATLWDRVLGVEDEDPNKGTRTSSKKARERVFEASSGRTFEACRRAVADLGFNVTHSDRDAATISFNSGRSWRSWAGQDMTVTVISESPGRARAVVGGSLATRGNPFGGGSQVTGWGEKMALVRRLFETVHRLLPDTPEPARSDVGTTNIADELARLAELRERGVLTDEEFQVAKQRLLEI